MRILDSVPSLSQLREEIPKLKALFWDMDGTLINTEKIHALATFEVIHNHQGLEKIKKESIFNFVLGQTDTEVFRRLNRGKLLSDITLPEFISKKDELFLEMIKNTHSSECLKPEVSELLETAQKEGIINIVVTSSEKKIAKELLEYFKLNKYFHQFITREDTARNKPDPAPYKLALKLSQVTREEVVIFEDSPIGLEAARLSRISFIQANWY